MFECVGQAVCSVFDGVGQAGIENLFGLSKGLLCVLIKFIGYYSYLLRHSQICINYFLFP